MGNGMNKFKLQNLRFFVAVYEEGSISSAARKVNATQSGVSVQVRDLEEQLGLVLFDRISTGVEPTKAGEIIYHRAVRILREVGGLGEDVAAYSDSLTGAVRVGIMPTFARSILAPTLAAFSKENPLVDVKVTEGFSPMLTQMVLSGQLDFAVVPEGATADGLRSSFLSTDLEILVSYRALEGVTGSVDLAKIAPLNLVLPGPSNARRAKIDAQLRNFSQAVHDILEMDSMMATLDIIRHGEWCSILPGCLCLPDLGKPDIYHYPLSRPRMTVNYIMIEPTTKTASIPVQVFASALAEKIQRSCEVCREHFDSPGTQERFLGA